MVDAQKVCKPIPNPSQKEGNKLAEFIVSLYLTLFQTKSITITQIPGLSFSPFGRLRGAYHE